MHHANYLPILVGIEGLEPSELCDLNTATLPICPHPQCLLREMHSVHLRLPQSSAETHRKFPNKGSKLTT